MVWCKDCSALGTKKRAAWGMPQDGKKQWCAACGRDHEGAVDLASAMRACADCNKKNASWGMPQDRKRKWCAACRRDHEGAVDLASAMCADCNKKYANWGMPQDRKRKWCATCGRDHEGAVDYRAGVQGKKTGKSGAAVGGGPGRKTTEEKYPDVFAPLWAEWVAGRQLSAPAACTWLTQYTPGQLSGSWPQGLGWPAKMKPHVTAVLKRFNEGRPAPRRASPASPATAAPGGIEVPQAAVVHELAWLAGDRHRVGNVSAEAPAVEICMRERSRSVVPRPR
jgi:hypothetical protein